MSWLAQREMYFCHISTRLESVICSPVYCATSSEAFGEAVTDESDSKSTTALYKHHQAVVIVWISYVVVLKCHFRRGVV